MSNDHAEKIIAEMKRFDGQASPMPRWFGAKREASFAMLRRFHRTAPPSLIYHYTSSAALVSIVVNNELWLSEATYLNDRHEIELGRRLACDLRQGAYRSRTFGRGQRDARTRSILFRQASRSAGLRSLFFLGGR